MILFSARPVNFERTEFGLWADLLLPNSKSPGWLKHLFDKPTFADNPKECLALLDDSKPFAGTLQLS